MREVLPDDLADEVRGYLDDFGVSVAEDALDDLRASERRALTFRMPDGERVPIEGLYQPSFKTADLRRIEHGADDRLLLITDYVHPRSAEALRTAGVWYVDGPGNAHIRWPGLFVDVQGRKRPAGVGGAPRTRHRSTTLFTRKKSQVIAAILARPDLLREPFRTVAHCSGTSLGLVKTVIDDLAGMGFVEDGSGGRRPGDLDALLGLWAPSYAAQVPTPFGGEGTVAPVVPEGIELLLSGEQAVPELIVDGPTLTAYVDTDDREGLPTDLIRVNRWRRSETPNIRLRHKFWQDLPGIHEGAAPAPIVYADLIGANEGRQREAAGGSEGSVDQVGGVDYREYADVARVVGAIAECVEPDRIMLVGARCRNILHGREFGSPAVLRRTSDTDLAIAIEDWAVFDRLHERFGTGSSAWQRMMVSGIPTDIVPFGPIERPPGWIGRTAGDIELNVHGFADVFRAAEQLYIDENLMIRLPTPSGYAVLKTHSWLDRIRKFEYKDAPDLALCVHWYANRVDRLWGEAFWAMEEHNFNTHTAAAAVLGRDMGQLLSRDELMQLCSRLGSMDTGLLANHFDVDASDWPDGAGRLATVEALFGELVRCKDSAR